MVVVYCFTIMNRIRLTTNNENNFELKTKKNNPVNFFKNFKSVFPAKLILLKNQERQSIFNNFTL